MPESAFDTLRQPVEAEPWGGVSFEPNDAYDRYLRIHKVFVGQRGANQLADIHQQLATETLPRYLAAAGSAAAEAALMGTDRPEADRLELLERGVSCWQRALERQQAFNQTAPECLQDCAYPYRLALDMATAPLVASMIRQDVDTETCRQVFEDCLNIAEANAVQLALAIEADDINGIAEHAGFGHECNFLLAFNRTLSPTWFALPSMARCDSGYDHRQQTHDLVIIQQRWGKLVSATPTEVKSTVSQRDKNRYDALLVRGKMHLCAPGKFRPTDTLRMVSAVYDGTATLKERQSITDITERLTGMAKRYRAGESIGQRVTKRSVTVFRDSSQVAAYYPGLSRTAAA